MTNACGTTLVYLVQIQTAPAEKCHVSCRHYPFSMNAGMNTQQSGGFKSLVASANYSNGECLMSFQTLVIEISIYIIFAECRAKLHHYKLTRLRVRVPPECLHSVVQLDRTGLFPHPLSAIFLTKPIFDECHNVSICHRFDPCQARACSSVGRAMHHIDFPLSSISIHTLAHCRMHSETTFITC